MIDEDGRSQQFHGGGKTYLTTILRKMQTVKNTKWLNKKQVAYRQIGVSAAWQPVSSTGLCSWGRRAVSL